MIISLSGFMGCGKSTVGRMLLELLPQYLLIDLDSYIEKRAGRSIPDIFSSDGETAFRAMEAAALEEIFTEHNGGNVILSLGGGTLMTPLCASLVGKHSVNVYLMASEDYLVGNLMITGSGGRPMLKGVSDEAALRARVRELLALREATYMACAARIVPLDGRDYEQICSEIASLAL